MTTLTISQLARRSGVPATTLRYYEKIGVIPAAMRSDAGYRLYDDAAAARLAFVQRAKALGIQLDDLADLVRLWDGEECAPVQERLRAMVHDQRTAARQRTEELTKLAAELDAVGASIGDAACGPDCACLPAVAPPATELPLATERLIGAACALGGGQLRERLRAWRELRDRATSVEPITGGARLAFSADEPIGAVADLAALESECCAFYVFTLQVDGPTRQLEINAGAGGEPAVRALLGLERAGVLEIAHADHTLQVPVTRLVRSMHSAALARRWPTLSTRLEFIDEADGGFTDRRTATRPSPAWSPPTDGHRLDGP